MDLTIKYRPQSEDEWVGNKDILVDIEEFIQNSIPVILVGPPGGGKTSLVYMMGKKLGYEIVETNASDERRKNDLKDLKNRLSMKTFVPVLFDIEEVDGLENQDFLAEILKIAKHPVVLTANHSYKLSHKLKRVCKVVEVNIKPSQLGLVVQRMKNIAQREGKTNVNYNKVSTDIRASIRATFEGSQGYDKEENNFEKVKSVFLRGKIEDVPTIWLLDNAPNFYFGKDLIYVIKILGMLEITGRKELLACLPRAKQGKVSYPYYLKKSKVNNGHNRGV